MDEEGPFDTHDADDGPKTCSTDDPTQRLGREHVAVDPLELMGLKHVNRQGIGRHVLKRREHVVYEEQRAEQRDVVGQVGHQEHGDEQRHHAGLSNENPGPTASKLRYLEAVNDGPPEELERPRQRAEC